MCTEGASELAKYFAQVDSLVEVNLARNEIEEEGSKEVFNSLGRSAKNGNLKILDFGENHIDSIAA